MPTEKELDDFFKELTKYEERFCEEMRYCKNKNNIYIYESEDRNCSINLPLVLNSYKKWLIDYKIVKEV